MPSPMGDIVRRQARINSTKVGLVDGDELFTYSRINERVNRLGNSLLGLGLKKGEKVAFMANNCHEFVEAYFAVAKTGHIIVPVNARFTPNELIYQLNHSESDVLIYHSDFCEIIAKAKPSLTTVKYFVRIGDGRDDFPSYEALLSAASPDEPGVSVGLDDVFMIMYTSGSTGMAKGVITTQRNILAATNIQTIEAQIVPEEINLLVMPLFHAGGLWPTTTHFHRGAKTILLARFDEEKVLQVVEKERVTFLNLVPATLRRLANFPDLKKYDFSSLRLIMYAAAPIPLHQLRDAMRLLGPHRFFTGLGSTESGCGGLCLLSTTEHAAAFDGASRGKLGSVGRDAVGVEVKIVDDNGVELPTGVVGQVIAKGDNITLGYWKMPEETAETFRDGWLFTGDLGYRDEDGYVFLTGRKKDLIISGGENVSSLEVEETISQHPAVDEVAVIGVPDETWGEAVKAVIVLKPDRRVSTSEEEIIRFCRERLAAYKCPRTVDFIAELPKSSVGKIIKVELKEKYRLEGRKDGYGSTSVSS